MAEFGGSGCLRDALQLFAGSLSGASNSVILEEGVVLFAPLGGLVAGRLLQAGLALVCGLVLIPAQ